MVGRGMRGVRKVCGLEKQMEKDVEGKYDRAPGGSFKAPDEWIELL